MKYSYNTQRNGTKIRVRVFAHGIYLSSQNIAFEDLKWYRRLVLKKGSGKAWGEMQQLAHDTGQGVCDRLNHEYLRNRTR